MNILALDVTTARGSLAVRSGGLTLAELVMDSPEGFGHILFAGITEVLERAGLSVGQIDCFASASGPGSFTGVRLGLTAVKGMAEALARPVAGISNLRALGTFGNTSSRAVLLDARRGDVYAALYSAALDPITEETVGKLEAWLAGLPFPASEFVVQDEALLAGRDLPATIAPPHLAAAVALCAEIDGENGRWLDPAALDANYVRRSDAQLFLKEI